MIITENLSAHLEYKIIHEALSPEEYLGLINTGWTLVNTSVTTHFLFSRPTSPQGSSKLEAAAHIPPAPKPFNPEGDLIYLFIHPENKWFTQSDRLSGIDGIYLRNLAERGIIASRRVPHFSTYANTWVYREEFYYNKDMDYSKA